MLDKISRKGHLSHPSPPRPIHRTRKLSALGGAGILTLLIASNCLASEESTIADTIGSASQNRVEVKNDRLSVEVGTLLLVDLMKSIGNQADIRIVTSGEVDIETGPWSFSDMELAGAIGKLLKDSNAIVAYSDGKISTVYLLATGDIGVKSVGKDLLESNPPGQTPLAQTGSETLDQKQALFEEMASQQALSNELNQRVQAIDRLQGLSDDLTVTRLAFSLHNDPAPEVRSRAIELLEEIGGPVAATALEEGLGDDDALVRQKVIQALGRTQDERVPLWLGQVLMGDPNAEVRLKAVQTIAHQNGTTAEIFLQAATNDQSEMVSAEANRLLK